MSRLRVATVLALVLALGATPASAAHRPHRPHGLRARFEGSVVLTWHAPLPRGGQFAARVVEFYGGSHIPDASSGWFYTVHHRVIVPFDRLPGVLSDADETGYYTAQVRAMNSAGHSSTTERHFKVKALAKHVNTIFHRSAVDKVTVCFDHGLSAGVTTGTSGGIVKALAAFIPGVGEVRWAQISAAIAGASGSTFIHCLS